MTNGVFPEEGLDWRIVLRELYARFIREPKHLVDNIIGSMTTMPHPLSVEAYKLFMFFNANDPIVFRETHKLEREVISMLGEILGGEGVEGLITSGGTEANISALYLAREHGYDVVYAAITAHSSIRKAARILRMRLVEVEVDKDYHMDLNDLESKVKKYGKGVIVATAGTTGLGTVDNVRSISDIAIRYNSVVHVDAAFGGFIIPFLRRVGYRLPDIGFNNEAVVSVTIDPHKLGLTPIPSGGLVVRGKEWFKPLIFESKYMPMGCQVGLGGTRSGGSIAATWAMLKHLGWKGYTKLALEAMNKTFKVAERIRSSHVLRLVVEPETPIICMGVQGVNARSILEKLWNSGWYPYHCGIVDGIRIVVMPHVDVSQLLELVEVVEDLAGTIKRNNT